MPLHASDAHRRARRSRPWWPRTCPAPRSSSTPVPPATTTRCTPTRCSPPRWPATPVCSPTGCSPWAAPGTCSPTSWATGACSPSAGGSPPRCGRATTSPPPRRSRPWARPTALPTGRPHRQHHQPGRRRGVRRPRHRPDRCLTWPAHADLAGKVVLVTGASRGIGEAIARRFAAAGAAVAVSARTVDEGDHPLPGSVSTTVRSITAAGGTAVAVAADLSRPDDRSAMLEQVARELGPIDVLVNNAAVTYFEPAADLRGPPLRPDVRGAGAGAVPAGPGGDPGHGRAGRGLDPQHLVRRGPPPAGPAVPPGLSAAAPSTACARRRSSASPPASRPRCTGPASR